MYAVIDIGSNTIRLSIYKRTNNDFSLILTQKTMAGIIGYVDEMGIMSAEGIKVATTTLKSYKQILENIDIKDAFVFATASLRNIKNTYEVVAAIKKATEFDVDVMSGEMEGIYDFRGATRLLPLKEGLLIDIGGGSTELVQYSDGKVVKSVSLPIGSLNMYNKNVSNILPSKKEVVKIRQYVKEVLANADIEGHFPTLCGIGGTVRGVNRLDNNINDYEASHKTVLIKDLRKMLRTLVYDRTYATSKILRVIPERVHTILPGIIILEAVAKKYRAKEIMVSDYGVREGYLYTKLFI